MGSAAAFPRPQPAALLGGRLLSAAPAGLTSGPPPPDHRRGWSLVNAFRV
eukprot:CAMPEP_0168481856 /NCGR_PEP_ID=MMETSP0228-20121227/64732_1 /TAXON_ID=133427 /ORGANISM="Protoceratium reticulatum, Strain CCCM 535 (=CCMP 1889)" /LENGTH=49 /DNA_ID= /DNA_START= /DNA_END= /DNA_ORIENTATION=